MAKFRGYNLVIESDQALKAFIENSLAFVKRIQEQPQQAGQEAGGNA